MAQTNRAVLTELRAKLGRPGQPVTHQAIAQRRDRLRRLVQMPTDIATYIVAARERVRLDRHLNAETLERVALFEERLRTKESGTSTRAPSPVSPSRRVSAASTVRELRVGDAKIPKAALSQRHMDDARRMAEVYPLLYAFENSVREFIDGHLTATYGPNWSDDTKIVNSDMKKRVDRNRNAEKRHRYHSTRSARFIYYTDIGDLPLIVQSQNGWKVFKGLKAFPSDKWLAARIETVEPSRNVIAHMNPVKKRDVDRVKLTFEDWLDQVRGHEPPPVP